jgi:hypothetical protein
LLNAALNMALNAAQKMVTLVVLAKAVGKK